jgi:uncharacterized cupredoxin-like copper-binding protein
MVLGVVALMIGGCDSNGAAPEPPSNGSEPDDVTIVAVDYEYAEAPAQLEAGVINLNFENHGTVAHEIALVGIGDTPLDEWTKWLGGGEGLEGKPFPDYLDQVAVPPFVGVEAGQTGEATFSLTEGRYALFCAYQDVVEGEKQARHYQLGMIRELTVSGGDAAPELPGADGTITATDYAFHVDVKAGDRTVNFVNESPDQVHYSTVGVYPKGIDAAEAEAAIKVQLEPGPAPKGLPQAAGLGFSGIFSEGLSGTFQLYRGEFVSGRTYLFRCSMADREGGKPHDIAYNMYKVVTIE